MAEDDDDEAFGDFSFAPFQSNSLFNAPNSSAASAEDDEDDEWGDFVQPPSQSKQPPEIAVNGSGNSAPPASWMKPGGALPLLLFGDVEEEVVAGDVLAVSGDSNREKSNGIVKSVSNSSKTFSIVDLYDSYSQIKHESQNDSVDNGVYSSADQNTAESAGPELKSVDLSKALVVSDHNLLMNKSANEEFGFKSYMLDPNIEKSLIGGWNDEFNGFSSNLKTSPENLLMLNLDLDVNGEKQQLGSSNTGGDDDDDNDDWDFKDANSEFQAQHANNNGLMVRVVSESSPYASGTGIGSMKSLDLFGTSNGSVDFFAEPADIFPKSSAISTTSHTVDLIGIPSSATLNGFTSDEHSSVGQNNVRGLLGYTTNIGIEELDEDFGDFSAASAENRTEQKESLTNNVLSPIEDAVQTPQETIQEKDTKLNHHKGAIPLSIFGDEEPERGSSSDAQDFFLHQSIPAKRSDHISSSVNSINDMISNLYSQAEPTSTNIEHELTESQLNLSSVVSLIDDGGGDDDDGDDDDTTWDFKDASEMRFDRDTSVTSMGDVNKSKLSKLKLDNYLDFYLKLNEELCFIARHHIDKLKDAQGEADLSAEGGRASAFAREFQLHCNEPEHVNFHHEEGALQDRHTRDSHLHEFAEILLEPQFQKIESEYHLSQKLLMVEKDLGSSMELIRHASLMLKILNLGTMEQQNVYVSIWTQMISVCNQELRHGASIWKHAVSKHVQKQFLSDPRGRKFILALGEIYRVVVVLGASATLFKPWILSGSVDSPSIYILLEECHAVWSNSGLEEALSSVMAPTTLDDTSLFKSIRHILGLDVHKLEDYVFGEKESRCRLSLLTAGVVPDLKIVMWGNEQCFITLANLQANLINRCPPELPDLNLG